jgi:large subunit ribosomal protein L25
MSDKAMLQAEPRERAGKGAARAVRREGRVPAVIYGGKEEPVSISIDVPQLTRAINRGRFLSPLYELEVGGKKTRVIPRDIQLHPVSDQPIHIDFLRLGKGAKIAVNVAVHFTNEETCLGLKRGGALNIVRHEVELNVPADAIPEFIEADLDGLDISDSVHISAVKLPKGVTPTITDRDFTIATIAAPSGGTQDDEDEEGETEGEAAAEGEAGGED